MSLVDITRLGRFLEKVKGLINDAVDNHTHSEYFPTSGGTINGDVNVAGVMRVHGQQAFYYATSSKSQTVGTNNATGGTTICCGSSANVTVNGTNMKTSNILPNTSNSFTLGNTTYRWKGIYSNAAVNVASDKRLKRDIRTLNEDELIDFVSNLHVVSYNYKDDPVNVDPRIGMIAQDVQKANFEVAKFFVSEDENGYLGLKSADLVFPLIVAVQKLSARVNELEAR